MSLLRITLLFILLLGTGLFSSGCEAEPENKPMPPLIVINEREISKAEFIAEFEKSLQKDQPLTGIEREELQRLRRENRILEQERSFLKKAAAYFAEDTITERRSK